MNNHFLINGKETTIFAVRADGSVTPVLIDTTDLAKVASLKGSWFVGNTKSSTDYCFHSQNGHTTYMHRLVNDTPRGLVTDHLNCNGLDNRKSNLENVTTGENVKRGYMRRVHVESIRRAIKEAMQKIAA